MNPSQGIGVGEVLEMLEQELRDLDHERRLRDSLKGRARAMAEQRDLDRERDRLEHERRESGIDRRAERLQHERQMLAEESRIIRRERRLLRHDPSLEATERRRVLAVRSERIRHARVENLRHQSALNRDDFEWIRRWRDLENRRRELNARLDRGEGMNRDEWKHRLLDRRQSELKATEETLLREEARIARRTADERSARDHRRLLEIARELAGVRDEIEELRGPLAEAKERAGSRGWEAWALLDDAAIEARAERVVEVVCEVRLALERGRRAIGSVGVSELDPVVGLCEERRRVQIDGARRLERTRDDIDVIQARRLDVRQNIRDLEAELGGALAERRSLGAGARAVAARERILTLCDRLERQRHQAEVLDMKESALASRRASLQRELGRKLSLLDEELLEARLLAIRDSIRSSQPTGPSAAPALSRGLVSSSVWRGETRSAAAVPP